MFSSYMLEGQVFFHGITCKKGNRYVRENRNEEIDTPVKPRYLFGDERVVNKDLGPKEDL